MQDVLADTCTSFFPKVKTRRAVKKKLVYYKPVSSYQKIAEKFAFEVVGGRPIQLSTIFMGVIKVQHQLMHCRQGTLYDIYCIF